MFNKNNGLRKFMHHLSLVCLLTGVSYAAHAIEDDFDDPTDGVVITNIVVEIDTDTTTLTILGDQFEKTLKGDKVEFNWKEDKEAYETWTQDKLKESV